jgi:hypothetical protein
MKTGIKVLFGIMTFFMVGLLVLFLFNGNIEFSSYGIVTLFLFYIIIWMDKKYNFPLISLWFFSAWIIMHLLGGGIKVLGVRLYDLVLINIIGDPYFILRYDQFVHAYCYFAFGILFYYILKKHMKNASKTALIVFAILSSLGVGLLNEVIEFGMVVFADAADAVGGYINTALDLVFNLIGAIIGVFFAKFFLDK